ncbi:MAG: hypothetical protein QW074_06630 [Candidatus Caldarchaeum sp.]
MQKPVHENSLSSYIAEACRRVYAKLPDVLGITEHTKPEEAVTRIKHFFNDERSSPFTAHVVASLILKKAAEMMSRDGYQDHLEAFLRLMEVLDE